MATFATRVALANDATMAPRFQCAAILTALAVAAEPRPAGDASQEVRTASHVRRSFARDVLKDPGGTVPRLRWLMACTSLADITAPTDEQILASFAEVWSALAGA